jgi:hypothetical protein
VIDHDLKELDEWSKKLLMSFNPDTKEIMLFSNTDIPEFNFTQMFGVHQLKQCKVKKTNCLLILSVVDLADNSRTNIINYYPHRMI